MANDSNMKHNDDNDNDDGGGGGGRIRYRPNGT